MTPRISLPSAPADVTSGRHEDDGERGEEEEEEEEGRAEVLRFSGGGGDDDDDDAVAATSASAPVTNLQGEASLPATSSPHAATELTNPASELTPLGKATGSCPRTVSTQLISQNILLASCTARMESSTLPAHCRPLSVPPLSACRPSFDLLFGCLTQEELTHKIFLETFKVVGN